MHYCSQSHVACMDSLESSVKTLQHCCKAAVASLCVVTPCTYQICLTLRNWFGEGGSVSVYSCWHICLLVISITIWTSQAMLIKLGDCLKKVNILEEWYTTQRLRSALLWPLARVSAGHQGLMRDLHLHCHECKAKSRFRNYSRWLIHAF